MSKVRLVGGAGSGMIYVAMATGASASRPVIFLKMALFIMLIRLFLRRQDSAQCLGTFQLLKSGHLTNQNISLIRTPH